ncbi:hypothetical protein [Microlunatus ginsengisoli]|uniref:Uncharacterized protein n=1 Tax=Microlunatus ginsengisoli TaxID=363863 RepID=A0ABP7AKL8_9ACTN
MNRRATGVGRRFRFQAGFAAAAFVLMILRLIGRDWIEVFTGWDPDRGSGAFESLVVAVLGLVAIGFGVAAAPAGNAVGQGLGMARGSDDA